MARFLKLDLMEISGFKSFYGRTRFEFTDGITGVVGPNGCGKSNIGDAISWVLGQQKASLLRSDRMEDVIFNGSDARRPLGMAEVSLHFKNVTGVGNGDGPGDGHGNGHDAVDRVVSLPGVVDGPVAAEGIPERGEGLPGPEDADEHAAAAIPRLVDLPEDVVVTRRIYRSGESEYILNGRRCRLRDIQDLLARTDIGSRLYSTIEQGKIDQILISKPKERRALFEEAAGILGYKTKRRQTEIKLEATQINLSRISDITSEVERQVGSLKRQAAKARRYRDLRETLRERRAALIRLRLLAVDSDRAATFETLSDLKARDAETAAGLGRDDAELERLRLQMEDGEEASRRRKDEIHALDIEIDRLQERIRSGQEQSRELAGRLEAIGPEIGRLSARRADLEGRREALGVEGGAEASRVREAESALARVGRDVKERAGAIAEIDASLEQARASLMAHLDHLAGLSLRRASLEEQKRSGQEALDRVSRQAADLEAERGTRAEEIAALEREARTAGDRVRLLTEEHQAILIRERQAAETLAAAERHCEELKGRSSALEERLDALRERERERVGYPQGVGEILRGESGFTPPGVVGERLDVPRDLARAVEATLGPLLDAILVSGNKEASLGIEHLRRNAGGRARFVAVSAGGAAADVPADAPGPALPTLPQAIVGRPGILGRLADTVAGSVPPPIAALLSRALLVEDLDRAFELHASDPDWAYVTLEGDIVHPAGVIEGGDGRALQDGFLARRSELEEIARQSSDVAAARDRAEAAVPSLRRDLTDQRERLREAEAGLQEQERTALERDLFLKGRRDDLARIDRDLPRLVDEQGRLGRELAGRAAELEALAASLGEAEQERHGREETIRATAQDLASRRAELERVQEEEAAARLALAAGQHRLGALDRERGSVEEGIRETGSTAERRAAERGEWTARVDLLQDQDATLKTQLQSALETRAAAAQRDESAHAGLAYDRGLLHSREQSLKEARAAHAALREQAQERELHLVRLEADLDHLRAACLDDLKTTLEDLRSAPSADEGRTLEQREAEIEDLRAALDAIGPVNLMAIEQQNELEERFRFLSAQKKDLDDSIASLRETIRRIDRESRQRFQSAFEAIQGHFQECFRTLFGGGTAGLRLQEGEEDVLEAGIEILAQPPGKKLQKIALLSGGEKALTAVALLFSLFRYRPSPFCVLDEVDAPLDDANVGRFTRLLQELRDETQFILITHNRKSMEAADLLYGVTMEEPGISKVLPLRFE
jgi:chromosome segregation protein